MKIIQKSLLFASLLSIGAGITSIPTITQSNITVQAATKKTSPSSSTKCLTADTLYYRVGHDKFISARDIKIITSDDSSNMDHESLVANDFRLEVTSPKASLYTKSGKKDGKCLKKGTICKIGNQDTFSEHTYYKSSKDKLVALDA